MSPLLQQGQFKSIREGIEELAEQGRAAPLVLVEDQGSVPITYTAQLIKASNCSSWDSHLFFWPLHTGGCTCRHADAYTQK